MYSPATFNRRQWRAKNRERNLLAAVLSIIVIALLSTSLAQPKWFYFKGGECTKKHLGVYEFFYIGYFELRFKDIVPSENDGGVTELVYHSYNESECCLLSFDSYDMKNTRVCT